RRAVFNVLIGNRDDHLRNHGFLRTSDGWRLAPAFDINPNPDKQQHALLRNADDPRALVHIHEAPHPLSRLNAQQAADIEKEVRETVNCWQKTAAALKLPRLAQSQLDAIIDAARD